MNPIVTGPDAAAGRTAQAGCSPSAADLRNAPNPGSALSDSALASLETLWSHQDEPRTRKALVRDGAWEPIELEHQAEPGCAEHILRLRLEQELGAREAAEAALARNERLLAGIAHELRNPLAVIACWSQTLSQDSAPAWLRDRAGASIARNVQNMLRLVEQLIDNARSEFGSHSLALSSVDLAQVVRGVVEDHLQEAERQHLALSIRCDTTKLHVDADAVRLTQIFHNLLGNGLKFTPAGGSVSVDVSGRADYAQVSVADSGRGIAREHLESTSKPSFESQAPVAAADSDSDSVSRES
jgi:signal transduction histidine kinase